MALKKCMESFIEYKLLLDDIERNGLEDTAEVTYEKQFTILREATASFKTDGLLSTLEGEKKINSSKNRYKDIVPYDQTRVKLSNAQGSDYINASHIQGVTTGQRYIAAQGPMPETVNDFWQMLWDNNVKVILMACNEYEGVPRKLRCQRYWANSSDETLEFGGIFVTLLKEQKANYDEYTIRHLTATRRGESRDLVHLHYTAWPDRGVPRCIPSILDMIELMRVFQSPDLMDAPPVVVHCSAGCGRTGTIIVLDYVSNMIKFGKLSADFSLHKVILELRKQRMAIVQSLEQYVFVHEAVVDLFTKQLEIMQNHVYYDFHSAPQASTKPMLSNSFQNCEYEDVVLVKTAAEDQVKPTPPVKPDKLLQSKQAQGEERPVKPQVRPRKPSTPTASDDQSCVYASPFGRPPVTVPSKTKGSTVQQSSIELNPNTNPCPQEIGLTAVYADVKELSTYSSLSTSSSDYAYADPDALGKWSLQHIARNPNCLYAEVGVDSPYATVEVLPDNHDRISNSNDSDVDENTPELPQKRFNSTDSGSVSSLQLGPPGSQFFAKIKNMVSPRNQSTAPVDSTVSSPLHTKQFFRGIDISYPNRVGKPKYGQRDMNGVPWSVA